MGRYRNEDEMARGCRVDILMRDNPFEIIDNANTWKGPEANHEI